MQSKFTIKGLRLAGIHGGVKRNKAEDLMLAVLPPGSTVGGVFTRSTTASAAVLRCRRLLPSGRCRAVLVNSGNANVFTGAGGEKALEEMAKAAAKIADCATEEVFVASTGVIGEPLPYEKIIAAYPKLAALLGEDNWQVAAKAILTTDTKPKTAFKELAIGGQTVRLGGFAKGAGMIAPNMATMLAFIFTDLALTPKQLQTMLNQAMTTSFNAITVEGDTSTSDTCLLVSTNGIKVHGDLARFAAALNELCADLAKQIVMDAEGAKKFITVKVSGGENEAAARKIAFSIAESPLVKIALGAADPNWGRIIMAIGKTELAVERNRLAITLGGIPITENGALRKDFDEKSCSRALAAAEISVEVELGAGDGQFTVWTCDLNAEYVRINADYRS